MILYFSGTGNSRYAAELLSEQLNEELLDLGKRIKSGEKSPIFSTGPWVFVSPTYGWQLPHIFEEYLRAVELLGAKRAYFVLTCGSDIGGAGRYLAELCQAKGLIYRGTLEVVRPKIILRCFLCRKNRRQSRSLREQSLSFNMVLTGSPRIGTSPNVK